MVCLNSPNVNTHAVVRTSTGVVEGQVGELVPDRVGEQPLPHPARVVGEMIRTAMADTVKSIGARIPLDAVSSAHAVTSELSGEASRAISPRAASAPVSILIDNS